MSDDLEWAYSPRRGTIVAIIAFFALAGGFLGYMALTEQWTPASTTLLRIAAAVSVLGFLMCAAFSAILLRSKNWRLRVDSQGVSIDSLFGRRTVAWSELQSVQMVGEGRLRAIVVTGANSRLGINAMLMSDPSQLERVFDVLQRRLEAKTAGQR